MRLKKVTIYFTEEKYAVLQAIPIITASVTPARPTTAASTPTAGS